MSDENSLINVTFHELYADYVVADEPFPANRVPTVAKEIHGHQLDYNVTIQVTSAQLLASGFMINERNQIVSARQKNITWPSGKVYGFKVL